MIRKSISKTEDLNIRLRRWIVAHQGGAHLRQVLHWLNQTEDFWYSTKEPTDAR